MLRGVTDGPDPGVLTVGAVTISIEGVSSHGLSADAGKAVPLEESCFFDPRSSLEFEELDEK